MNRPGWTVRNIADWALPWIDYLKANSICDTGMHRENSSVAALGLPANFVDCTPFNLIKSAAGRLVPFDLEWVSKSHVPFHYVVFRGLFNALCQLKSVARPALGTNLNTSSLVLECMRLGGMALSHEQIEGCLELEQTLQETAYGRPFPKLKEDWRHAELEVRPVNLNEDIAALRARITERDRGLAALQAQVTERRVCKGSRTHKKGQTSLRAETAALCDRTNDWLEVARKVQASSRTCLPASKSAAQSLLDPSQSASGLPRRRFCEWCSKIGV